MALVGSPDIGTIALTNSKVVTLVNRVHSSLMIKNCKGICDKVAVYGFTKEVNTYRVETGSMFRFIEPLEARFPFGKSVCC